MRKAAVASIVALSLFFTLFFMLVGFAPNPPGHPQSSCTFLELSEADHALIQEAFHLQGRLGQRIWADWTRGAAPFLYKTSDCDFLINHPAPPSEFERSDHALFGRALWHRPNADTVAYQATYPISGFVTAVMTAPEETDSPHLWVLKAAHELFHVYQHEQSPERVINPFVGPHSDKHELSYPFPYDDDPIRSLMRIEAEEIFRPIADPEASDLAVRMASRVLRHVQNVATRVFRDSLDLKYKRWQEWSEGVARYTERELAALAADSALYAPSSTFAERYPTTGYAEIWGETYAGALNPIRFVGEGVQGRIQFYYLGMGKAYLLDLQDPDWKQRYFSHHLDHLLTQ